MADIFVSYARQDRHLAEPFIALLEAQGWSVWWDREIGPGASFRNVIEGEIAAARCVLVLWTSNSVASDWVNAEANEGLARRALIPVRLENVNVPLVFRQTQSCDLFGWPDATSDRELDALMAAVSRVIERPVTRPANLPSWLRYRRPALLATAVLAIAMVTALMWAMRPGAEPPAAEVEQAVPTPAAEAPPRSTAAPMGTDADSATSIRVLPFEGMARDLSREVATALARAERLQIVANEYDEGTRTDVARYSLRGIQRDDRLAVSLFDDQRRETRLSFGIALDATPLHAATREIVERIAREFDDRARWTTEIISDDLYLDYLAIIEGLRAAPQRNTRRALIEDMERLLETTPRFAEGMAYLCRSHIAEFRDNLDTDEFEQAERRCARAARLDGDNPWVETAMGNLFAAAGQHDQAAAAFERALGISPFMTSALAGLALVRDTQGRLEDADALLLRAQDLEPNNWSHYAALAALQFTRGDYERASMQYEEALQRSRGGTDMFNDLGAAYFMLERFDAAINLWEQSVLSEPTATTLSNLGSAYYFQRRFDDAIASYMRAIDLGANDYRIWLNAGEAAFHSEVHDSERFHQRALELALETWRVNPDDPDTISALASVTASLGDEEAARRYLSELEARADLNVYAIYDLAVACSRLGERARMQALLEKLEKGGYPDSLIQRDANFAIADEG